MEPAGFLRQKVFAHIDMDAFFASVEMRDNPDLVGKPVIVGADPKGGRGRGVVSTCSYEARRYGVHSAMPISQAYRLCPRGIFLPVDMHKYAQVSDQLFGILYDFTPDIEAVSVDEAFLDVTGSQRLLGTPLKIGGKIKSRIKEELRLNSTVGIAPTKMVAKMASTHAKPDGLLEITEEKLLDFLWPLPVEDIWGVGAHTQKALNALGIQTIGDLARTPAEILRSHLGVRGEDLWELANGRDEREVIIDEEIKSVSHEHTFEEDTPDPEKIHHVLSFLSEKVSRRLRRHGLKARTITLKVRLANFKTSTRDVTLPEPTNFFDTIYTSSKRLFDAFHRPGHKYRLVGVRAAHFHESYVRASLFEDPRGEKAEKLHKAVDLIKDRFGERGILRAEGLEDS